MLQGTHHISAKDIKTETNRKRKQSVEDFDEDDENRDWWTKYFASVEAMIEVTTIKKLYFDSVQLYFMKYTHHDKYRLK